MFVRFYENGYDLKFSKQFYSESNAIEFTKIMEKLVRPDITVETELYVDQYIPINVIGEIAKENILIKNLSECTNGITKMKLMENNIPYTLCTLTEETVVQNSKDTAIIDYMFDLFSRIVCGRDYSHLLHLNADSGGEHLMLEKIYEILDDMVDEFGEKFFMARNIKIPNPLSKNQMYASGDLGDLLSDMIDLVDKICKDPNLDESMKSMVSGYGEDFQRCMGFWRQAQMDSPNK